MEEIEWSRPMAPLLPASDSSSESELSAAESKPRSTPSGHSFNPLENRFTKNPKKFLSDLPILDKILFVYGDAEQWF